MIAIAAASVGPSDGREGLQRGKLGVDIKPARVRNTEEYDGNYKHDRCEYRGHRGGIAEVSV